MNKATELMRVAYATFRRGERDLARDICALAFEQDSAGEAFGQDPREAVLSALRDNDIAGARRALESLSPTKAETETETPEVPAPRHDLEPAQLASLVSLARRIKAEGHEDLAGRITEALGL